MEIVCAVQNYEWGKRGLNSLVARLAATNKSEETNSNRPYAELWMGVHPNGPSKFASSGKLLSDMLNRNNNFLGLAEREAFGDTLPFLFKVLSVNTALSIQAHPNKTLAEELFAKYPDVYKDPNHKPELAIAITEFEALCGFRPKNEIQKALNDYPELRILLGNDMVEDFLSGCDGIRTCFEALMKCDEKLVKQALDRLLTREETTKEIHLIRRLSTDFPGDVGALCVFWLNYIVLKPGEAIYLAANEPHAYIFGDCIECMANSDNVVRAGLTPKYRDVSTLCSMLTYQSYKPEEIIFAPAEKDEFCSVFRPPVPDFAVAKISIPAGKTYSLKPRSSASILLTVCGESTMKCTYGDLHLKPGIALFMPAAEALTLSAVSELLLFQAMCNL